MYYRGKLAPKVDPSVWKFHRTYTPQKVTRKMSSKKFNSKVYPRFQEFLSNKQSRIEDRSFKLSQFEKPAVKIPKGSRLERDPMTFQERNEEFQFMRRERLRFLKKKSEQAREKTLGQFTYRPQLTERRGKQLQRELEDLFLWDKDKREKISKKQREAKAQKEQEDQLEAAQIQQKRKEIGKRLKKKRRREKKRPQSSNVTDRWDFKAGQL